MAKASSENGDLKKILNHLSTLDKRVDTGFKEADKQFKGIAEFRQQTEENFAAVNKRMGEEFKAAADDRQAIRHEMQAGFKSIEEFRKKTEENFSGLFREMPQMGSELYDKIEGRHKESLIFQQEALSFQKRTEDFQRQTSVFQDEMRIFKQQALDFQTAMQNTIQHFTRVLERIDRNLSVIEQAFEKLKIDHEKLKQEVAAKDAVIKKLEQSLARLGVA